MGRIGVCLNRHESETNTKIDFCKSIITTLILFSVVVYITKDNAFINFEGSKSMIFSYVSAAVWLGFSNTISIWSCEQRYIMHRIQTGLISVTSYLMATSIYQMILSAVQALLAIIIFSYFDYEKEGLLFGSLNIDIFITFFLTILGTSLLGIVIGTFCTTVKAAIGVLPLILVSELLFSNGIFELTGKLDEISLYIHARHAISAIGSLLNINQYPLKLKEHYPMIVQVESPMFQYTKEHILECWIHLGILCVIAILISYVVISFKVRKRK